MKICVINASNPKNGNLNDCYYNFKNYSSYEDGKWRSWHSIPCALRTEFFPYGGENFEKCYKYDGFIVLVDKDFEFLVPFIKKLKMLNKKVFVGYHEGMHIVDNMPAHKFKEYLNFKNLVNISDGYWNLNPSGHYFFESLFDCRVVSIPTCAPFDEWNTDYLKVPFEKRDGIIIGTRTLNQVRLKRNTFFALSLGVKAAKKYNTFVTYVNEDIDSFSELFLKNMFGEVIVFEKRRNNYADWLKLIAKHKVLFQLDGSHTHGQVVSDAVLVNVIPTGGRTDNDFILDNSICTFDKEYKNLCRILEFKQELMHWNINFKNELSFKNTKEKILKEFNE